MPGPAAILNIIVTANTAQANANLAKTQAQLNSTAAAANRGATSTAKSSGRMGTAMASAAKTGALAFAAAGAAGIKMAIDFEDAMSQISTQAGASTAEVEKLKKPILDLAKASEFGPVQLAKGLFRVESAGYRGAQAMKILKSATDLADVGHADLEETTRAYVAAIRSGIKGTEDFNKTAGTMNAIVGQGSMRMNDLVAAFGTGLLPRAKNVGVSLDEVGAALGVLTEQGMGASQSATRLGMTFSFMVRKPTADAAEALGQLGIKQGQMAQMLQQPNGLLSVLKLLHDRLEQIPKAQRAALIGQLFGGGRGSAAIQTLLGSLDQYTVKLNGVRTESGNFSQKIAEDNATLASKLDTSWAYIQARLTELGTSFNDAANFSIGFIQKIQETKDSAGPLGDALDFVTGKLTESSITVVKQPIEDIGDLFSSTSDHVRDTRTELDKLHATIKAQSDAWRASTAPLSQYGDEVHKLYGEILRTNGALKATRPLVEGAWKPLTGPDLTKQVASSALQLREMWKSNLNQIYGITKKQMVFVAQAMKLGPEQGQRAIKNTFDKVISNIQIAMRLGVVSVQKGTRMILDTLSKMLTALGATVPPGFSGFKPVGPTNKGGTPKIPNINNLPNINKKRSGGLLAGPSRGDKIPLLAEGGEFMVNSKATKRFRPYLEAMNRAVPRFAGGGQIPNYVGQDPGVVDDIGAAGMTMVATAARKYLARVRPRGAAGAGKMRSYPRLSGDTDFAIALGMALSRMAKAAGTNISVTSGYRSTAEQASLFAANPNPMMVARPGQSHHQLGIAADISPGRSVFGALAAKFGLRFPMSWEPWHIELAKYQKGGLVPGNWNKNQLTTLAAYVGMKNPALMAAIAMAESAGNPNARGSSGEYGLWQIMPSWGGGSSLLNPLKNARKAKHILGVQGLGAWTTYTSGAYRRFLGGKVKPGLLSRLRGGTTGKTAAGMKAPPALGASMGFTGGNVDAMNARIGAINDIRAARNLLALQGYQVGAAQNPILGLASPAYPSQAPMLPGAMEFTSMDASNVSAGPRAKWGFHTHVYIDGKEVRHVTKKQLKRTARGGRRRLPSAGGG